MRSSVERTTKKGARVLLVSTNRERQPYPVVPNGPACVASALDAAGHDVRFVDLCFARAFRDARGAWEAAEPRLQPGGRLVYFAGETFDDAADLPAGVVRSNPLSTALARGGTLVIMARQ